MSSLKIKPVLKVIGVLLMIEGLFMATAIPFSIHFGGIDLISIAVSSFITFAAGLIIWFLIRKYDQRDIGRREGYLIVSLIWVIMSAFGALPFYLSGYISNFTNAYFETISGFTTTGASILTDIEALPKGLLYWRSLTHWIGGMGIIVLSIAILPFLGFGGQQMFWAEVPGPDKEKLHPRISVTARRLWGIYGFLTFLMIILLMLGHMSFYEALCHSFGAVSSGGFSPKNNSIVGYSPYIQYVVIVFMFLAGTNFSLFYIASKGNFKKAFSGVEFRVYGLLIMLASLFIAGILIVKSGYGIEQAFRSSLFEVTSTVTCTGYATDDYMLWPQYAWFIVFLLMFSGGMAGSTAGGIKIIRHILLFKNVAMAFNKHRHPMAVLNVRVDGKTQGERIIHNVLGIFVLYIITFAIGSLILTATGLNIPTSMGSVVSCMGGIGPGLYSTGPVGNYAHLNDIAKWTLSFLMLLGRLELFSLYILFMASFWKK
jgi:trk system potassium uptake protein TrkH